MDMTGPRKFSASPEPLIFTLPCTMFFVPEISQPLSLPVCIVIHREVHQLNPGRLIHRKRASAVRPRLRRIERTVVAKPTNLAPSSRSSPRIVRFDLSRKKTISSYVPFLIKTVTRFGGLAGTKSIAPCTVLKSPLPSAATTTRVAFAAGAAALVLNVHPVSVVTPAKPPPAGTSTPGSICTTYLWP